MDCDSVLHSEFVCGYLNFKRIFLLYERIRLMTSLPVTQKKLIRPYIVLLISSTLLLYSLTKLSGEIGHAYGAYLRTKVISS